ncbi:Deoxyribonuclease-1-like 1 [Dissostichus eleginoides]|uniref:Deoxyribonuclease-1-like 1 n=1 Tax=Dissostichus eleginoides TaxID=100907 RepID=A0AAD9CMG5_DISEL|nr:Deoxyribonuclease-1-like 1 [Dissostichus eleginoides]
MEITEGIHTACCAVNLWDRRVDRRSLSTSTGQKHKKEEVEIKDSFQYGGNAEDVITRQPFVVLLKCPNTAQRRSADALHDVVEDNIMILGDFNAAGKYLSKKKKETLSFSSARYHWLIDDDVVTMTRNNKHTYDRMWFTERGCWRPSSPTQPKPTTSRKS